MAQRGIGYMLRAQTGSHVYLSWAQVYVMLATCSLCALERASKKKCRQTCETSWLYAMPCHSCTSLQPERRRLCKMQQHHAG